MTKPKRIILLVVDIVTVLSGLCSLLVAAAFFALRPDFLARMPSHQETYTLPAAKLRTELQLALDHISFLSDTADEWAGLLMFFGAVMLVGSILRLVFTPWRLPKKANDTV